MHILFLTPRLPYPPNRGDRLRPWNFAKSLAKRHTLHLVSLIQHKDEERYTNDLEKVFDHVEMVLLKPWQSYRNILFKALSPAPFQVPYFHSDEMHDTVARFLEVHQVDVIYIHSLRMAPYVTDCQEVYRVLDLCDSISMFLQRRLAYAPFHLRLLLKREQRAVWHYEREIVKYFDEIWIISRIDRQGTWRRELPDNLHIVPNGVDTTYFSACHEKPRTKNIIFAGYMGAESVDAVTWFYKQMFPAVRRCVPEARLYVVGANPPPTIRALEEDADVVVTGFVEDLRPYYDEATVAVAPMRFVAGMQNKVLEAMAMEVPVVSTTGANEGIDAQHGREIFVADDPTDFANRVVQLLDDRELVRNMGRRARGFVQSRFPWDVAARRIEHIDRIVTERRS